MSSIRSSSAPGSWSWLSGRQILLWTAPLLMVQGNPWEREHFSPPREEDVFSKPTMFPSQAPSTTPSVSLQPSSIPSEQPSATPTSAKPTPTPVPTLAPTKDALTSVAAPLTAVPTSGSPTPFPSRPKLEEATSEDFIQADPDATNSNRSGPSNDIAATTSLAAAGGGALFFLVGFYLKQQALAKGQGDQHQVQSDDESGDSVLSPIDVDDLVSSKV